MSTSDPKDAVRSQFGRAAADYATSQVHAQGESLHWLLRLTGPQPHWQVLDIATGAGHTALAFAPVVRQVIATDLTPRMLEKTSELAAQKGLRNVTMQVADAESLPFTDRAFDLVTCRLAFHHFPDPRQALSEVVRVLRPGGLYGFADNFTVEDTDAARYYNQFEKLRDPSHHRVWNLTQLQQKFVDAGLDILATRKFSKEFEFHQWADRQRVSDADKQRLLDMMRACPPALLDLFRPRWTGDTMYFQLWEVVLVARRRQTD